MVLQRLHLASHALCNFDNEAEAEVGLLSDLVESAKLATQTASVEALAVQLSHDDVQNGNDALRV